MSRGHFASVCRCALGTDQSAIHHFEPDNFPLAELLDVLNERRKIDRIPATRRYGAGRSLPDPQLHRGVDGPSRRDSPLGRVLWVNQEGGD